MILTFSGFVVFFNIVILILLNLLYRYNFKSTKQVSGELPKVSILISVRNEQDNIPNLLEDLDQLDYPMEKLEILIGNDNSDDDTLRLLQEHTGRFTKRMVDVDSCIGQLRGKMNVLAQLGMLAKGDCLLFTDGDMRLNKNWVRGMVAGWQSDKAMVAGFTNIKGNTRFSALQNVDLFFGQGMVKVLSDLGCSIAVMGNNMMVDKKKYDEVGGYQSLPFSIVEDVALMRKFRQQGFRVVHQYNADTLLATLGCDTWSSLMRQRKRWMESVRKLPVWLMMIMTLKFSFLPALLYVSSYNLLFVLFFIMKAGLSLLFFEQIANSVKISVKRTNVLVYEVFEPIVYFSTLVFTLLPFRLDWKGRRYNRKNINR